MKGRDFMRYLADRTKHAVPSYLDGSDPAVEMYDGTVRVFDQRGESCSLRRPLPRQLRALALQLQLCAEEIERRGYETKDGATATCPRCGGENRPAVTLGSNTVVVVGCSCVPAWSLRLCTGDR